MDRQTVDANHEVIVLFDGDCVMCSGIARWLMKHDRHRRLKFGLLGSDSAKRLLGERLAVDTHQAESIAVIRGNEVLFKSEATLAIYQALPYPWRLYCVLKIFPRPVRDWMYDLTAKYRYRIFGRNEVCFLPTEEQKSRFID